jgi:hypothetical protein
MRDAADGSEPGVPAVRFHVSLSQTIFGPDLNSKSSEMSNMIALVLLDFGGTGSMCGIGKGVDADGRAFS